MKIELIVDGNIAGWARFGLIALGSAMVYSGLAFHSLPKVVAILLIVLGLPISGVGGYASRAKALGLKPFDNSYKKARKSYEVKDEDDNSGEKK